MPALVRLVNEAFLVERDLVEGDRTDAADVEARLRRGEFLAAFAGDALIGCVYLELRGSPPERGFFGMLAVAKERQGTGLGRRLVDEVEASCRARGCRFVDIHVVNVRTELPPFYRRLGYAESGSAPFVSEQLKRPVHFVRMTKAL